MTAPLPASEVEHVATAFEHPDGGWAYACLCGYESHPHLTQRLAERFAANHDGRSVSAPLNSDEVKG
jgi:hypothetical protein